MKFSGLARLVCSNFWVGSTTAQSHLRDAYFLFFDLRPPLGYPCVGMLVIPCFRKCWLTFEGF